MTQRNQDEDHPLTPALRQVEEELASQLDEACEATDVAGESTGELIRLEETLSFAARTAKEAVSLRRRIHGESDNGAPGPDETDQPDRTDKGSSPAAG